MDLSMSFADPLDILDASIESLSTSRLSSSIVPRSEWLTSIVFTRGNILLTITGGVECA